MSKIVNALGVVFRAYVVLGFTGLVAGPTAIASGLIAEDLDNDTDVDADDFALFKECLSGSSIDHDGSVTCQEADIDHDGDVDMADFGVMQKCYSGPGAPGSQSCGGCVYPKADRTVGVAVNPVYSGQSATVTVANSQQGANYQLRNNADNADIGSPVPGTGGLISLHTGPLTQSTTFNVLATNAVWGCSVQLSATADVTVNPYVAKNKIGVHVVIGSRNGYGPFIQNCAAAGKPVALVKCLDDFGAASEAKQYSPQTLTIGRVNEINGHDLQGLDYLMRQGMTGAQGAAWYFNQVKPKWLQNPSIDVWETCNEWSNWDRPGGGIETWQGDFYMAFMDLAEADGFRLALWACSGGNPPERFWPEIARTCARAKAHGNHILALHEYAWSGLLQEYYAETGDDVVLRYRRLYNYLQQYNADCPLALTEVGENGGGGFVGIEPFVNDFGWYDTQIRQDPYVIGCAAWTLGNWSGANFQDALPALTQYIITH